jgi:hypothetical protein
MPDDGADTSLGVRSCKNSKSRFEMNNKIPSRTEVKSSGFFHYGTSVICFHVTKLKHSRNDAIASSADQMPLAFRFLAPWRANAGASDVLAKPQLSITSLPAGRRKPDCVTRICG